MTSNSSESNQSQIDNFILISVIVLLYPYLVAPMARSRADGFHYPGDKDGSIMNGSVAVVAKVKKKCNDISGGSRSGCNAGPMSVLLKKTEHKGATYAGVWSAFLPCTLPLSSLSKSRNLPPLLSIWRMILFATSFLEGGSTRIPPN